MTDTAWRTVPEVDRPRRTPPDVDQIVELVGAAASAAVLVWVPFHLAGWNAPFGFVVCWFACFVAIYSIVVRQRHGLLELKDRLATLLIWSGISIALLPLVLLLSYTIRRGAPELFANFPRMTFIRHQLQGWAPPDSARKAGMRQALVGTIEQVGLATLFSVPVGILAATYLNEIGGWFAAVVRTIADAMTGLPSIIAGLLVYSAWIEPHHTKGFSGFAAAMALAVVMLPTVIRTAEEVLRIVAGSLREAALALGAPEWRVVLRVVLPTARTGLVTATILGIARSVGETAPVLLTAFGNPRNNFNPFSGPQDDLPLRIYQLVKSPSTQNTTVAWGGALLLILIILTLFTLARIIGAGGPGGRRSRASGRRRPRRRQPDPKAV